MTRADLTFAGPSLSLQSALKVLLLLLWSSVAVADWDLIRAFQERVQKQFFLFEALTPAQELDAHLVYSDVAGKSELVAVRVDRCGGSDEAPAYWMAVLPGEAKRHVVRALFLNVPPIDPDTFSIYFPEQDTQLKQLLVEELQSRGYMGVQMEWEIPFRPSKSGKTLVPMLGTQFLLAKKNGKPFVRCPGLLADPDSEHKPHRRPPPTDSDTWTQ